MSEILSTPCGEGTKLYDATGALKTDAGKALGDFSGVDDNTVLGFLRAMSRKDLPAPSQMGGTYLPSSDSLERIGDLAAKSILPFETGADSVSVTTGAVLLGDVSDTWNIGGGVMQIQGDLLGGMAAEFLIARVEGMIVSRIEIVARIDRTAGPAPTACDIDLWNFTTGQFDNFDTIVSAVDDVFIINNISNLVTPDYTPPVGQNWRLRFNAPLFVDDRQYVEVDLARFEGLVLLDVEPVA